ncbi:hypothetical protein Tco_0336126 [Tanacetum coccineum]
MDCYSLPPLKEPCPQRSRRDTCRGCGFFEEMQVLLSKLIFTFPCELRTSPRVPSNFDNGDTTLLLSLDFTIDDLHWFFNEVKLVSNMYFIQCNCQWLCSDKISFKLGYVKYYEPALVVEELSLELGDKIHEDIIPVPLRAMSSLIHSTSNIEDAFSSNFPDYILASPDYVLALPRKTYSSSSNNSFGLVPIASPTLSLFHDDPYMKVMHAYYAKESPIPPPTIVPPSSMFNPQDFFLPEELLPLKKQGRDRSSSSTSALPREF